MKRVYLFILAIFLYVPFCRAVGDSLQTKKTTFKLANNLNLHKSFHSYSFDDIHPTISFEDRFKNYHEIAFIRFNLSKSRDYRYDTLTGKYYQKQKEFRASIAWRYQYNIVLLKKTKRIIPYIGLGATFFYSRHKSKNELFVERKIVHTKLLITPAVTPGIMFRIRMKYQINLEMPIEFYDTGFVSVKQSSPYVNQFNYINDGERLQNLFPYFYTIRLSLGINF